MCWRALPRPYTNFEFAIKSVRYDLTRPPRVNTLVVLGRRADRRRNFEGFPFYKRIRGAVTFRDASNFRFVSDAKSERPRKILSFGVTIVTQYYYYCTKNRNISFSRLVLLANNAACVTIFFFAKTVNQINQIALFVFFLLHIHNNRRFNGEKSRPSPPRGVSAGNWLSAR